MSDGTGLAEALLGLDGFRVLRVDEGADELVVTVETVAEVVGCGRCGVRAASHDRKAIDIRDLTCFGRPARLRWIKRRSVSEGSLSAGSRGGRRGRRQVDACH